MPQVLTRPPQVLPDYSDLYSAHSSWFIFQATNRIFKHWKFAVSSPQIAATEMSFSSYPGFLVIPISILTTQESLDDFYMMNSGLALVQTTNSIFNFSLYDACTPQSLLAWQRVRLSNHMATSGEEWFTLFEQYNSGCPPPRPLPLPSYTLSSYPSPSSAPDRKAPTTTST